MGSYYRVVSYDSLYGDMIGELVHVMPRALVLEFKMNSNFGGTHRVMFKRDEVMKWDDQ